MKITAVYQQKIGETHFMARYDVADFSTNGRDCDTPEILAALIDGFRKQIYVEARGFEVAADYRYDHFVNAVTGLRVLAFFSDTRAKALIERWTAPIIL